MITSNAPGFPMTSRAPGPCLPRFPLASRGYTPLPGERPPTLWKTPGTALTSPRGISPVSPHSLIRSPHSSFSALPARSLSGGKGLTPITSRRRGYGVLDRTGRDRQGHASPAVGESAFRASGDHRSSVHQDSPERTGGGVMDGQPVP